MGLILWICVALLGFGVLAELVERRLLTGRLRHLLASAPTDRTGVLTASAYEQRTIAELRRVARHGGRVQVAAVVADAREADDVGYWLAQSRLPVVAFRMGRECYAVVRTTLVETSPEEADHGLPDDYLGSTPLRAGLAQAPDDGDTPGILWSQALARADASAATTRG